MAEKLVTITPPPGFFANGTNLQAEGRWFDGKNIRFRNGKIAPVGGYVNFSLSGATISGIATGALAVPALLSTPQWFVFGTDVGKLYAMLVATGLVVDISPTVTPPSGTGISWTLSTFGSNVIACAYIPGAGTPNYWVWDGNVAHTFVWASGNWADTGVFHTASTLETPLDAKAVVVTPEHFLMLLGGTFPTSIYGTTTFQSTDISWRRVYWASQGQSFDFRPADVNSAGDFDIPTKGILVGGKTARGETLIWSTEDLWSATYIGAPFYYGFEQKGQNCGLIGSNAACVIDSGAYWLGPDLRFYTYDHVVRPIPCDVEDTLRAGFNPAFSNYVWCLPNSKQGEITWFYPGAFSSSAQPCTESVTYNYEENHWTHSSAQQFYCTAGDNLLISGAASQVLFNPTQTASKVIQSDIGTTRTSTTFVRSGPIRIGEGDNVVRIQSLVMDEAAPNTLEFSVLVQMSMEDPGTLVGPFVVSGGTSIIPLRLTGRFVSIYVVEQAPATDWRLGKFQIGIIQQGRR